MSHEPGGPPPLGGQALGHFFVIGKCRNHVPAGSSCARGIQRPSWIPLRRNRHRDRRRIWRRGNDAAAIMMMTAPQWLRHNDGAAIENAVIIMTAAAIDVAAIDATSMLTEKITENEEISYYKRLDNRTKNVCVESNLHRSRHLPPPWKLCRNFVWRGKGLNRQNVM